MAAYIINNLDSESRYSVRSMSTAYISNLDLDEIGFLIYCHSLAGNLIHVDSLMKKFDIGKGKYQRIMKSLQREGFAELKKNKNENGQFSGTFWHLTIR